MTTDSKRTTDSWCWKGCVATWRYHIPTGVSADPLNLLKVNAVRIVRAMEGFARARSASWTSIERGEDAIEQDLREAPEQVIQSTTLPDPTEINFDLDLCYTAPNHQEDVVEGGGWLWLELAPDIHSVSVLLYLRVDFYAWRSSGWVTDNRATAELNAPKLRTFLERLQRDLGAKVVDIDAQDYPGQVDEFGFHPPIDETS